MKKVDCQGVEYELEYGDIIIGCPWCGEALQFSDDCGTEECPACSLFLDVQTAPLLEYEVLEEGDDDV